MDSRTEKEMYDKEFLSTPGSDMLPVNENQVRENILDNSVEYDDINMSSFQIKDELNNTIWGRSSIRPKVRLRLLKIAQDFWDDIGIKWVDPIDVIVTGSIANYNWSCFSDIDLHIIVDFSQIDENKELVKELMDSKKNLWNDEHNELTLFGFNVEVYVQDKDDSISATGIYSLYKNAWLRKPSKSIFSGKEGEDDSVRKMAANIINSIDELSEMYSEYNNGEDLEDLSNKVKSLYDSIKKMRKDSLEANGEFSQGDKVYKVLRRAGYLEKLIDLRAKTYDKIMSM